VVRYLVPLVMLLAGCQTEPAAAIRRIRIAAPGPLGKVAPDADDGYAVFAADVVYESLLRFGRDGSLKPGLIKTFKRLDSRRMQLEIPTDVSFSDGSKFGAPDVVAALAKSGLRVTEQQQHVLVESTSEFLPLDLRLVESAVARKVPSGSIGTGPFVVVEEDPSHILLRRRVPAKGKFDEVLLTSYPSGRDAFAHTLNGGADLLPIVDPRTLEFFAGVPSLKLLSSPAIHSFLVSFNSKRLDAATRRELTASISSERVSGAAFGLSACVPSRDQHGDAAETLKAGVPLKVLAIIGQERAALAVRRELGLRGGEIEILDTTAFVERVKQGDFDLVLLDVLIPTPAMAQLNWHTGSRLNFGYSNALVDAALDKGDLQGAAKELELDPPATFICKKERIAVVDSRIKNAQLGPFGLLETLPDWEVTP